MMRRCEDDVAHRLREEARRSGRPFVVVVNEAPRRGLADERAPRTFTVVARDLGLRPGVTLADVEGLIERLEGPDHR